MIKNNPRSFDIELIFGIIKSTSQTACDVDEVMAGLGFLRTSCSDVPDPSGLKHKQIDNEANYRCDKQFIYHTS